jgi:hypothetical protein
MPSYIAEEQRGTEARILGLLFPSMLQGLQLIHQAANQHGAPPPLMPQPPIEPFMEHRNPAPPMTQQLMMGPARPSYPILSQLAADRSFMDVVAVLMPTVQALMPPLVEQLLTFGPPKPEIDQNEEDRYQQLVPQLIGTLAPIVMQVLPGLLQEAGGYRSEQEVRITDRELNQRYFGPILQSVLPVIVSMLPELLAMVHGDHRSPVRYERMPGRGLFQLVRVSRNDLVNGHRLRDGDVLYLTETPAAPGTTEVRITVAPHGIWWKGVQVTDDSDRQICFAHTEGPEHAVFDSRSVQTGGAFVLWKAKLFGVHTPMYVIPAGDLSPDAKCFTFHWAAD